MPTPDLEERFRRWLKLIAEMHEGANFTANATIAWAPLRKPLTECSVALVSTACYVRFPTDNPIGEPNKPEQQRMILTAVLEQLIEIKEPGTIVELPFRWRRM